MRALCLRSGELILRQAQDDGGGDRRWDSGGYQGAGDGEREIRRSFRRGI
jgi:hypothetical protein